MSTLQVTFEGRNYTFAPGTTVRIGRSSENDIVVSDPTVSRRHAQLSFDASGWVWQNAGQAPTFLGGQPVAQFAVGQQSVVNLASPQGPLMQLASTVTETGSAAGAGAGGAGGARAAGGSGGTKPAAGAVHTNVAGQTPAQGTAAQAPGYAAAGAAAGAAVEGQQG
jgi:putative serine protease PepD